MKTEINYAITNFPTSEIYLDDIESVYALIKANFTKVELIIDGNILENWEEISAFDKKKVNNVKITGYTYNSGNDSSRIDFEVHPTTMTLYINDDQNLLLLGTRTKIEKIIESRRSPDFFKDNENKFGLLFVISVFIVGIFSSHFTDNIAYFSIVFVFFIIGSLSLYVVFFLKRKQNQIHLTHHYIEPNFFEKNRDQIILVIMSAVGGSFLTFLFNFFILKR